jgi:putative ABC transport system permease protein
VEHIRYHSLSKELRGQIYVAYPQSARNHISYVIRTRTDPLALAAVVSRELHEQAKDLAISKVRPMAAYVDRAKAPVTFTAVLAGVFAALAVLLAAIGIYGVVNYSVSRRMHEMGVRLALGANGRDLIRLVMREGLALTAIGMLLGLAGALFASRYLTALVYGISATDPATYALATAVIATAAILGCWRPATKAASANPVDAIRAE